MALVLGSLMPLAFAPLTYWPLAVVLPALLVGLIDLQTSWRRVFIIGWLYGLGHYGFGVWWVYNSLHEFGHAAPAVAGGLSALMIAYMALYTALGLVSWKQVQKYVGPRAIWLLPLFWFAFDWLRGWVGTGMPWLSLGYSQVDSPLSGFAPLLGVYGLSALCLLLSVALVQVVSHRRYRYLTLLVLIPVLGLLLGKIEWTEADSKPLKVSMVQGNIPQDVKWKYEERQNIFNIYWRETNKHWESDLIIWPETAIPGHSEEIEEGVLIPMSIEATAQNSNILTGIVFSDQTNNVFYNSMLLLGNNQGVYHKRHLVVFGEYFPLRWVLDFMASYINIPYSDLESGVAEQESMSVNGVELGISICFEDVFSREIRLALPEATILVNASNDAWFGDSLAPHQHLEIAQMRALEFGRPMLRSTNTGVSAFIDHHGVISERTEQFKTQTITQTVLGRTGVTPFYYFARVQGILVLIIVVGLLYYLFRKRGSEA